VFREQLRFGPDINRFSVVGGLLTPYALLIYPLLGVVNGGQISTTNFISSEKLGWAFYGQDDWKVSPKLTVSIGLRYEIFSPISERFSRQSNFVFDNLTLYIPKGKDQDAPLPVNFPTSFPYVKVSRGEVDKYLIPWDKTNFAPRIGLAYQINDKTVFRMGGGVFYERVVTGASSTAASNLNPPYESVDHSVARAGAGTQVTLTPPAPAGRGTEGGRLGFDPAGGPAGGRVGAARRLRGWLGPLPGTVDRRLREQPDHGHELRRLRLYLLGIQPRMQAGQRPPLLRPALPGEEGLL
jgi:hypothetical protein